ncbi:MAG TPA: DUF721 domain-containing protein [Chitinophagales bacterium]|nr:DUF721 domain-containing protein [Chitinophagales bacterium]
MPVRHKNEVTIGQAIDMMIGNLKLQGKLDESRIKDAWPLLMGGPIAKHTSSVSFKDGKMYVKVELPALKQELGYSREKIRDLFNAELGRQVIKDVFIF